MRRHVEQFFTGGNLLVKVGIFVLFVGVAFLLKYAAEHSLMPIELRLAGAAAGAIALLTLGWRLREGRRGYALTLQGGGVGVLYLTVFAAFRLYGLIPPGLAFPILVAACALSATLSVLQDAPILAAFGAAGGFLAPILTSTGSGSHVMLFSYYALLNGGILGIAWFKAWRPLNLVGFLFTFGIGAIWGIQYYQPEYFATTEPFLLLYFGFYVAVSILFALRQPPQLKGYVDGALVFGTPLIAFGLQAMLVKSYEHGLALSALGAALLYLGLAWVLFLRKPAHMRTLVEAFLAIGVIFGTVTIPLALDNRWTTAAWAMEGGAMVWVGVRQQRRLTRGFGLLLQIAAGMALLHNTPAAAKATTLPFLNGIFLGCAAIALAGLFSGYCLHRSRESIDGWEHTAGAVMAVWGLLWWLTGGVREVDIHVSKLYRAGSLLAFISLSCLACDQLGRRLSWPLLFYPALGLPILLTGCGFALLDIGGHPFGRWGGVGWPIAITTTYLILYKHEAENSRWMSALHALAFWLITSIAAMEASWLANQLVQGAHTWRSVCLGLIPSLLILVVIQGRSRISWPLGARYRDYLGLAAGPVVVFTLLWTLAANFTSEGSTWPIIYLPILNPLDVTVGIGFAAMTLWLVRARSEGLFDSTSSRPPFLWRSFKAPAVVLLGGMFVWLNGILARTVHHWAHIPFTKSAMMGSQLFQATISIAWSLCALCAMVAATRKGLRHVWITGAGLLAAVVLKLFLVDLSGKGTIERIVSFIVVGVLLLVIGYFAPVPPRRAS